MELPLMHNIHTKQFLLLKTIIIIFYIIVESISLKIW